MTRANAASFVLAIAALAAFGVGGWKVASRQLEARTRTAAREQQLTIDALRGDNRRLRESIGGLAAAKPPTAAVAEIPVENPTLPRLRALASLVTEINEGAPGGRAILPVFLDGDAGDEAAALLGITPAEVNQLETATSESVQAIIQLAFPAHVRVSRPSAREFIIDVDAAAYADEAKRLGDRMRDRYMSILGADRYEAFAGIGYVAAATRELQNMGLNASQMKYSIARLQDAVPDPQDPTRTTPANYALQRQVLGLNGRVTGSRITGALPRIREQLGLVGLLLPPDL